MQVYKIQTIERMMQKKAVTESRLRRRASRRARRMGDSLTAAPETAHLDRIAAGSSSVSPAAVPVNAASQAPSERGGTAAGVIAGSPASANDVGDARVPEDMDTDPPAPPAHADGDEVVVGEGEVVEMGSHQELLQKEGHYKQLHQMQYKNSQQ